MKAMNARERKLLAVGILIAVVLLLFALVVAPIAGGFSTRADEQAQLALTYTQNERLIGATPVWRQRANAQRTDQASYAIVAASPDAALDAIRQRARKTFAGVGNVISSVQALESDAGWVRAQIDGQVGLTSLTQGLRRLQTETPYLVVESVSIAADEAANTGNIGLMNVRLEIAARYVQALPQ